MCVSRIASHTTRHLLGSLTHVPTHLEGFLEAVRVPVVGVLYSSVDWVRLGVGLGSVRLVQVILGWSSPKHHYRQETIVFWVKLPAAVVEVPAVEVRARLLDSQDPYDCCRAGCLPLVRTTAGSCSSASRALRRWGSKVAENSDLVRVGLGVRVGIGVEIVGSGVGVEFGLRVEGGGWG